MDVKPPFAVEGRSLIEDTHLALLGVKKQDRHFGNFNTKNNRSPQAKKYVCGFFMHRIGQSFIE